MTRFTRFDVEAKLEIPDGVSVSKADKLLHTAERACLITNSLNAECNLSTTVFST